VEGFDGQLFEALRAYVTVYPYGGGSGVNPNTAPPHVLALIFFDDGGGLRLVSEDIVRAILEVRQQGGLVCGRHELEDCTPMSEILGTTNPVYPPLTFTSQVFTVFAEAKVGEVQRGVETVIDRRDPLAPQLLSWRVR
jgi:type II secretory pathway component PulK